MATVQPYDGETPDENPLSRSRRFPEDDGHVTLEELLASAQQPRAYICGQGRHRRPATGVLPLLVTTLEGWGSTLRALTLLVVLVAGVVGSAFLATAGAATMGLPLAGSLVAGLSWVLVSHARSVSKAATGAPSTPA